MRRESGVCESCLFGWGRVEESPEALGVVAHVVVVEHAPGQRTVAQGPEAVQLVIGVGVVVPADAVEAEVAGAGGGREAVEGLDDVGEGQLAAELGDEIVGPGVAARLEAEVNVVPLKERGWMRGSPRSIHLRQSRPLRLRLVAFMVAGAGVGGDPGND